MNLEANRRKFLGLLTSSLAWLFTPAMAQNVDPDRSKRAYGDPNGLVAALASNPASFNVAADIRNDAALNVVLQGSSNLLNWTPITWSVAPSQNGVATGFIRYLFQDQPVSAQSAKFYRLEMNY